MGWEERHVKGGCTVSTELANFSWERFSSGDPMPEPEKIICKPTPWFLFRAAVMFLMFSIFAVLFYKDGTVGYRHKNASYYLRGTFQKADAQFKERGGEMSAEEWRRYAAAQTVDLPADGSILPAEVQPGMKWPEILQDSANLKDQQWSRVWEKFSGQWPYWKMDSAAPEKPYDAGKIGEQWVVMYICVALAAVAAFFLLRTLGRKISVDGEALYTQNGKRIPFSDLTRLDLRKWGTKGLAFADYKGASGSGRARIDGLTYGGFKKEQDEPAEKLMQRIRAHFSGELIEYASVATGDVDSSASPS